MLCDQRELTYGELRAETVQVAQVLQALGIQSGERVAIVLNDSPEFIAAFVAIISLGASAVPINMALNPADQRAILADCTAATAIIEAAHCNTLLTGDANPLPSLKNLVLVRRGAEDSPVDLTDVRVVALANAPRQALEANFPASRDADAPAFILYTSGSTGKPKGAVHTQSDVFYTHESFCREILQLTAEDRLFSSSRLPFAYGLGNSFSFPLINGCTSILCYEKPNPAVIARVFSSFRPTIFFGVPVVFNLLLEHHRQQPLDCSSLRLCVSAGEALPAALGESWQETFGVEVLDGIGSTEMLHMWMSNHSGAVRYGSSGTLLEGYEARLLDQEGQASAEGEVGNLWVKGASAARGYWNRPDVTASTFVDGWVRTGDLYRCDEDGYWFHMGRSDDCFKSSGQWVSPVEVEGVLMRHSGVRVAAVVEDFDQNGLPGPCAFIVPNDESLAATIKKELKSLVADALPRFKRPRKYLFVSELPYTATGKIQRFKLREQLRSGEPV